MVGRAGSHLEYGGSQTDAVPVVEGAMGRGAHATPPGQLVLERHKVKQKENPRPMLGLRQMSPLTQSSCWEGAPRLEMVQEAGDAFGPRPAQVGIPSPPTVHFCVHQLQSPL